MNNHTTVIGRVGTQPEIRTTPWGALEATFRLATTERRRNKAGEWEDGHTSWFTVRTLRRLAEHVRASVHTGQQLIVSGRVRTRTWENERGKGMAIELDADHVGPDLLIAPATVHPKPRSEAPQTPDHSADSTASVPASGEPAMGGAGHAGETPSVNWPTAPVGVGVGVGAGVGDTAGVVDDPPF